MLHSKVNYWIFNSQSCRLCQLHPATESGLCQGCTEDLPWLLFPCHRCGLPLSPGERLCHHCRWQPPQQVRTLAPFHYAFPFTRLLPGIKYQRQTHHLRWIAHLMAEYLTAHLEQPPQLLLPVPMHPWNEIHRGYNQATLLCQQLAARLSLPWCWRTLRKHQRTAAQMTLSAQARSHNLSNAFHICRTPPQRVALIDDIMTTGSTVDALARLLKEHGCREVQVWVIARTDEPRSVIHSTDQH